MDSTRQNISSIIKSQRVLEIKREDLLHPFVSGNKFRKLKYNLEFLKGGLFDSLITFGGAFSNHIAATAYACKENRVNSVGIIRGEELWKEINNNPTLRFAQQCGMKFEFVTREQYREKDSVEFLNYLKSKYGNCYVLPEGGTNELAVKGCEEILNLKDSEFDYICCAVGTGGTISGIINSAQPHQKVIGFPALKGDFLKNEICKFAKNKNWELISDYHFGGYGKVTEELIDFINDFYKKTTIPLDPIYTGKMVYGVLDLIAKNYFPENSKILLIHTGGLQGIEGMNKLLEKRKMTKILVNE
ncbi:1-aminocyclopropane-1-carboxylate deaminase/D-cysteine desulfhydrase [Flavobacterium terrae]|uniref:1-aminocyclopropane-1-carboxylate deaminase n=1 Tax=Flavobacterium terrae TaxID=415425 RepID=A0A1M6DJ29_9FLAO|nr:pyridoxal-phosphate dependent enzyme [Flavobacterium terrae]SHI73133.1 1-aminocyclopropane-1-carboxylate deaminase [Flavobacterium terrae]